ncbi:Peroxidasin-like protein [Penaeus vannamei]|uniref:Peroxidasin-like protein n=1 Tax=Penaeus vannamei TaxID=6689 RepID=A0A3R7PJ92_PENVA|nr:Peroxidasin-like protein [Penaeus vannamei]
MFTRLSEPSPNHKARFNSEPPEKLTIYNRQEVLVMDKVGPINEGSPLFLACEVKGGRPQPTVSWWSDQTLVERRSYVTSAGHIRSELRINEVTRTYHKKNFSCQARNNNQKKPLMQEVTIEMNLRPLSVQIHVPEKPLEAGIQYTFQCESQGSRPAPVITWFEQGKEVEANRAHTNFQGLPAGVLSFLSPFLYLPIYVF